MKRQLQTVMLIDDDVDDNFFHERVIRKVKQELVVIVKQSATEALTYLVARENHHNIPDLIFLDINMPVMDGWEFLEAYNKLHVSIQSKPVIIMLIPTYSEKERAKAKSRNLVSDYITKPITDTAFENILATYFDK